MNKPVKRFRPFGKSCIRQPGASSACRNEMKPPKLACQPCTSLLASPCPSSNLIREITPACKPHLVSVRSFLQSALTTRRGVFHHQYHGGSARAGIKTAHDRGSRGAGFDTAEVELVSTVAMVGSLKDDRAAIALTYGRYLTRTIDTSHSFEDFQLKRPGKSLEPLVRSLVEGCGNLQIVCALLLVSECQLRRRLLTAIVHYEAISLLSTMEMV